MNRIYKKFLELLDVKGKVAAATPLDVWRLNADKSAMEFAAALLPPVTYTLALVAPAQVSATMVANNDPAPNVISASEEDSPAWHAWDGNGGSVWETYSLPLPHWNKYDSGSELFAANMLTIQAATGGLEVYAPKDFIIQGSNDDSNWTDLSTQTGIIFTDGEAKEFIFSNSVAYRYCRIYVTAVKNADPNRVTIAEMTLQTVPAGAHKDRPYNLGDNSETELYITGSVTTFILIKQSALLGFNKIFNVSLGHIYIGLDWDNDVRYTNTAYTLTEFNNKKGWRLIYYKGMFMELRGIDKGTGGAPTLKAWSVVHMATETADINVRWRGGKDLLNGWEERYTLNAAQHGNLHAPYSDANLAGYTVATLPTGVQGERAFVTDAAAPTYLGALTGGGAVVCPVFFDGTIWVSF